jgi:hypothetical protein
MTIRRACLAVLLTFMLLPGASAAGKFLPPEGKTLLLIGQDERTIQNYINSTGHHPAGFMVYTSIQEMGGLNEPANHGAGVNHAQYLADNFPNAAFQIGLYMVDALEGIPQGNYDANIDVLAKWLKESKHPVYLRIGYEFDLPNNHYDPEKYKTAFRYIVDRLRASGVDNVAYVWHSYGFISPDKPLMDWYPGDDYVDFFAVSFFKAFNMGNMNFILKRAGEHHKPFMIAEATPFGVGTADGERSWNLWFKPFFKFIQDNQIPVVSYINSDWESLPMFQGQGWGDARVQANSLVKERWLKEVQSDRYLKSAASLSNDSTQTQ